MNTLVDAEFYSQIKNILEQSRIQVLTSANTAMIQAYWLIGKKIVEKQGSLERAEYGKGLIEELSKQLRRDFGKGFTQANLRNMRQFYLVFQNRNALRSELSWTHYRLLIRVKNDDERNFYMNECVKSNWSTRQLERQINSFFYQRLLSSREKESVSLLESGDFNHSESGENNQFQPI